MAIIPDTHMAEDSLRQKWESVAFQILLMYKSHQPPSKCTEQRMLEIASHCVVFKTEVTSSLASRKMLILKEPHTKCKLKSEKGKYYLKSEVQF